MVKDTSVVVVVVADFVVVVLVVVVAVVAVAVHLIEWQLTGVVEALVWRTY